nr:unnamed protein product [Spirometra erinaceieuropaei]
MSHMTEVIQGYADGNETENFFAQIKAIYDPTTKGASPLFSSDGTTFLMEKLQILKRWAEHFRSVPNRPSEVSNVAIDLLLMWEQTTTLTFCLLSQKQSEPCIRSPEGKHRDPTRSRPNSASTAAPG